MRRATIIGLCIAVLAGLAGIAVAKNPEKKATRSKTANHNSITEGIDCGNCHTPASWQMTGGKTGQGFDHSRTGFPLTGRHDSAACNQCHSGERRVTRDCSNRLECCH